MATLEDIGRLFTLTMHAFPNWKTNQKMVETWFKMLKDLPLDNLRAAVLACNTEPGRVFAPSIGEIRGKNIEIEARANGVPTAFEAWEELLKVPRDCMVRLAPEWSQEQQLWLIHQAPYRWRHPLVEKVARQLGWPESFPGELLSVALAQFRDAYQAAYYKEVHAEAEIPEIREYVERRKQEIARHLQMLAERMEVGNEAVVEEQGMPAGNEAVVEEDLAAEDESLQVPTLEEHDLQNYAVQ
jgi:hypothetical protein